MKLIGILSLIFLGIAVFLTIIAYFTNWIEKFKIRFNWIMFFAMLFVIFLIIWLFGNAVIYFE